MTLEMQGDAIDIDQDLETSSEERIDAILTSFRGDQSELIPILQRVQDEFGFLPEQVMNRVARFTGVPESTIFGVATFYAQFKFVPVGKYVIKVCRGTGCYVKGAPRIIDEVTKHLGIGDGETTPDRKFTLETVACFGSCALAPVVVVNDKVYGRVTPDKIKDILAEAE